MSNNKKLKEIPFNHELIGKEGIVIKFRDGTEPLQVIYLHKSTEAAPVISVRPDGTTIFHEKNGAYFQMSKTRHDLIMFEEVEVKEPRFIWANVYDDDDKIYFHSTLERAKLAFIGCGKTIKFIEVIEEDEIMLDSNADEATIQKVQQMTQNCINCKHWRLSSLDPTCCNCSVSAFNTDILGFKSNWEAKQ